MRRCALCSEVAGWSVGHGVHPTSWTHYCYEHAAILGLLKVPLERLRLVGQHTDYPTNAVMFVADAVAQADHPCTSAKEAIDAIHALAERQFADDADHVIHDWRLDCAVEVAPLMKALETAGLAEAEVA